MEVVSGSASTGDGPVFCGGTQLSDYAGALETQPFLLSYGDGSGVRRGFPFDDDFGGGTVVTATDDGEILVASGNAIGKVDDEFEAMWEMTDIGIGSPVDVFDLDDGVVLAQESPRPSGSTVSLTALTETGEKRWTRELRRAFGPVATDDGELVFLRRQAGVDQLSIVRVNGETDPEIVGSADVYPGNTVADGDGFLSARRAEGGLKLVRTGFDARIEWSKRYDMQTGSYSPVAVERTTDDGFFVAGNAADPESERTQGLLFYLAADGERKWQLTLADEKRDLALTTVQPIRDGRAVVGGVLDRGDVESDGWVAVVDGTTAERTVTTKERRTPSPTAEPNTNETSTGSRSSQGTPGFTMTAGIGGVLGWLWLRRRRRY